MSTPLTIELARTRLFAGVSFDGVASQLERCHVIEVDAGTVLIEPGAKNDLVYLVLGGRLDVRFSSPSDAYHVSIGPGECAGEMSIIEERATSAFVTAGSDCRLLTIGQETMWSLVNVSHSLARNMLYLLSSRLRTGNEAIKQSMLQQSEYECMAYVDALTGLHNRRWLDTAFRRSVERGLRNGLPLALLMIDIDHFKHYNDSFGHHGGDLLLRAVAITLSDNVRPGDLLARYGGEEFAVLLPDTDALQAVQIAERLRAAVEQGQTLGGVVLPRVTISLGQTMLQIGDTLDAVLVRADSALYAAKSSGRNCVRAA